jgi:hypothetical protein
MLHGVLLVAIGFTLAADNPAVKDKPNQVVAVTARKLIDAYGDSRNDALAEERYTNHEVAVTGTVAQVVKGYEPDEKKVVQYYLKTEDKQLIFAFPLSARKQLANLELPETVTVRGTCVGKMVVMQADDINPDTALVCVCLRNCRIVKRERAQVTEQTNAGSLTPEQLFSFYVGFFR